MKISYPNNYLKPYSNNIMATLEQKKARAEYMVQYRAKNKKKCNLFVKQSKKKRNDDYKDALKFLRILKADYPEVFDDIKTKIAGENVVEVRDLEVKEETKSEQREVKNEVKLVFEPEVVLPIYTNAELSKMKVKELIAICTQLKISTKKEKKEALRNRIQEAQLIPDE